MQGRKCGAMQVAILGNGWQPVCDEPVRTGDRDRNRATKGSGFYAPEQRLQQTSRVLHLGC